MRTHLRNLIAVIVLIAVIYFASNYIGVIQQKLGLKNTNTGKAQQIEKQIGSDIGSQITAAQKQIMQLKVSDILNGLSRFKRIPQDATSIKNYVQNEFNNVLKSRGKK